MIAAGLVSSVVAIAPAASAAPDDGSYHPAVPGPVKTGFSAIKGSPVTDKLSVGIDRDTDKPQQVFVQLAGKGAAAASMAVHSKGAATSKKAASKKAAKQRRQSIRQTADAVVGTAKKAAKSSKRSMAAAAKIQPMFVTTNTIPGMAVKADLQQIKAMASRTDVVKITPITPKTVDNAGAAQFTKVLNTWQDLGLLGDGVTVGIIDTGIDYTHADFGGPGTVEAWNQAHENSADPWTPTVKVAGGYDFSGDDYNADPDAEDYQPVPHPDPNPLDCYGHGTHVAGTVAGYGENADGSTFTGDYSQLTGDDLYDMKIGPGMAPQATLYALKVFGCTGSTNVVAQALDWSLDPNGDGDFSDHLDIVNLSLGSDYGTEDDPENAIIDVLAEFGVLPVIAMGNANDVTDAGGSPGNAVRSLAVASVLDPYQLRDGLRVDAPADVAGIVAGQVSVEYDWANADPVSGDVVAIPGDNADGCQPFSEEEAAAVAGKVVWLEWDDNDATRRCGSVGRSANAVEAGAIGSIFTSTLNAFNAGISGSDVIPVFQIGAKETEQLRPALDAGTLQVTFDSSLIGTIKDVSPDIGDTISSFSSRGTHATQNPVKPDVAAPGSTIASAGIGTGDGEMVNSGTSMATPHVAGISALVRQKHPDWTTEQVKAAIMNTAAHDVFTQTGQTGDRYGPARVGAGRVDALGATSTDTIAYAEGVEGGVSATFGVVWAKANKKHITKTRTITVENSGRTGKMMRVSYEPLVSTPGVSYSVVPSVVYLRPHGTAKVRVKMHIQPKQLDHTIDPTMDVTTPNVYTGLDEPRQYVTDASGRVLLSAVGQPTLRVPVYGVAKPYSTTKAKAKRVRGQDSIVLKGKGLTGGYTSLASVLTLGTTSPRLPECTGAAMAGCVVNDSERSADLKYVGVGSNPGPNGYADGFLYFGLATQGNWATVGHSVIPYVDFDTNGDGVPDYEVFVQSVPDATGYDTDLFASWLVDLNTGSLISMTPVNFNYGDVSTNVFDGNVVLMPVDPAAIGITGDTDSFEVTYTAGMYSVFRGEDIDSATVTKPFDVVNPPVQVDSPLYIDEGGAAIGYELADGVDRTRAMVVHLLGDPTHRVDIVKLG